MRKLIAVVVVSAGMAAMGEVHEPLRTAGTVPRWDGVLA